jgi:hypothetical protein
MSVCESSSTCYRNAPLGTGFTSMKTIEFARQFLVRHGHCTVTSVTFQRVACLFGLCLFAAPVAYGQTWAPPVGIPNPGSWFLAPGNVQQVTSGGSARTFSGTGTAANPVVFSGVNNPTFTGVVAITGSYVIVENIFVNGGVVRFSGDHLALRNSEIANNTGVESKITVNTAAGSSDIVVFRNKIHDNGQWQSSVENDFHGVSASGPMQRMWILENEMYHHGGDSVQVGHNGGNQVVGLYIGRNIIHHDRENAVDLKEVSNAVVSENTMYGYRATSSSEGAAVVIHYCPINAAVVNNLIYDSQVGVSSTSLTTACDGKQVINRIVGNVIQGSLGNAIQGWGTGKVTQIANNTIYQAGSAGIDLTNPASGSFIENNIVNGTRGIVISGSLTQRNNLTTQNPLFVSAGTGDFHLASGSPAIDAGIVSSAFSGFQTVYGVSIAVDRDGRARPAGNAWDIGAYESNGLNAPSAPANLRIIR